MQASFLLPLLIVTVLASDVGSSRSNLRRLQEDRIAPNLECCLWAISTDSGIEYRCETDPKNEPDGTAGVTYDIDVPDDIIESFGELIGLGQVCLSIRNASVHRGRSSQSIAIPDESQVAVIRSHPPCEDDEEATFFVNPGVGQQGCIWLAKRPEHQAILCTNDHKSGAYFACRKSCGMCSGGDEQALRS
jgi:hypothetical protein